MNSEFEQSENNLQLYEVGKSYLLETSKWARFIAIIGFIGVGFFALIGILMGTMMRGSLSSIPGAEPLAALGSTFMMILYILIGLIYYFPIKYLYDFSVKAKRALTLSDPLLLEEALSKLKSHYKYIGILMIIVVSIYVLIFFFAILVGLIGALS